MIQVALSPTIRQAQHALLQWNFVKKKILYASSSVSVSLELVGDLTNRVDFEPSPEISPRQGTWIFIHHDANAPVPTRLQYMMCSTCTGPGVICIHTSTVTFD